MKRIRPLPFLMILAAILLVMSIPRGFSEKSRGTIISLFSPLWERSTNLHAVFGGLLNNETAVSEQTKKLQTENYLLQRELKHLQEIIRNELYLTRSGVERSKEWQKLLTLHAEALPARVIFRSPSSWNSSCWLNVGLQDNEKLGKPIIAKNSPVVVGFCLMGVIDFVGRSQSRVRLLTDSGLMPSVRAVRGEPRNRMLAEQLNLMLDALIDQDSLFESTEQKMHLITALEKIEKKLQAETSSLYLAKGILSGSSQPAWRSQGNLLRGTGFNCDFADNLSPARNLRTGKPIGADKYPQETILKVHDLLVTTGMDGVFPPGLQVAEVIHVSTLKEGDYYFELEAKPVAGNLDELSLVYVLPPVGYNPDEQPPLMGWE